MLRHCIFIVIELETLFHAWFVDIFMIYLHTRLHTLSSNTSLVITINQKVKHRFHAAMMLFYILQKKLL
jgi:hypothetical protein